MFSLKYYKKPSVVESSTKMLNCSFPCQTQRKRRQFLFLPRRFLKALSSRISSLSLREVCRSLEWWTHLMCFQKRPSTTKPQCLRVNRVSELNCAFWSTISPPAQKKYISCFLMVSFCILINSTATHLKWPTIHWTVVFSGAFSTCQLPLKLLASGEEILLSCISVSICPRVLHSSTKRKSSPALAWRVGLVCKIGCCPPLHVEGWCVAAYAAR